MCPLEFRSLAYSFSYQQIWLQPNNLHKKSKVSSLCIQPDRSELYKRVTIARGFEVLQKNPFALALLLAKNKMINGAHFVTRAIVRSRWVPLSDWSSWRSSRGCGGGGGRPPGRRRRRRRTVPPSLPHSVGSPLKMRGIGWVIGVEI